MGEEWTALERYLRTRAETVTRAQKTEAGEPPVVPSAVKKIPA